MIASRPALRRHVADLKSKDLMPMPVSETQTQQLPTCVSKTSAPPDQCFSLSLTLRKRRKSRQGANSASTAKVTSTNIGLPDDEIVFERDATSCRRASDSLCAPLAHISVLFIPGHGALQGCGDRACLKA